MQAKRLIRDPRPGNKELEKHHEASTLRSYPKEGAVGLRQTTLQALEEMLHADLHSHRIPPLDASLHPRLRAKPVVLGHRIGPLPQHLQLPELGPQRDQRCRYLQMQVPVLAHGDRHHVPDVLHPVDETVERAELRRHDESRRELLAALDGEVELVDVGAGEGFGDGDVLDDGGSVAPGLEGEERRGLGGIWGKLFDQLDEEGVGIGVADGEDGAEGAVEEGEIDGEGDAVVVVAGDAVVVEEGFLAELSHGVDAVDGEEVVEEEGVVAGQVQVAYPPHFVQGG